MNKKLNRYQLVHRIAEVARKMEQADRDPIPDKKNNYIKEVNKPKTKRNYVLEAYDIVMNELDEEAKGEKQNPSTLDETNDGQC